jgi:Sec-independent protein translocase protein TatA
MISTIGLLLVLGLIVFGPKKTMQMAQEVGRILAQVKQAAGQFQHSSWETDRNRRDPHSTLPPVSNTGPTITDNSSQTL